MTTNRIRINWLIPALGIALVGGGFVAALTYHELEQKTRSAEVSMARMDRLYQDLQLCAVLRTMNQGNANAAARHLDLLLCNDIVALDAQLSTADAGERSFVRNAFARFALVRPQSAEFLTDEEEELRADQLEAERIIERAGTGITPGNKSVAALP